MIIIFYPSVPKPSAKCKSVRNKPQKLTFIQGISKRIAGSLRLLMNVRNNKFYKLSLVFLLAWKLHETVCNNSPAARALSGVQCDSHWVNKPRDSCAMFENEKAECHKDAATDFKRKAKSKFIHII